jgi:hypothetical protein
MHQNIMARKLFSDIIVSNALVHMYAKYGRMDKAYELFGRMP